GLGEVLVRADLVVEGVARPAGALTLGAAALDHEPRDDPVEGEPVVERGGVAAPGLVGVLLLPGGQPDEVAYRLRGVVGEQPEVDLALARVQRDVHASILARGERPSGGLPPV